MSTDENLGTSGQSSEAQESAPEHPVPEVSAPQPPEGGGDRAQPEPEPPEAGGAEAGADRAAYRADDAAQPADSGESPGPGQAQPDSPDAAAGPADPVAPDQPAAAPAVDEAGSEAALSAAGDPAAAAAGARSVSMRQLIDAGVHFGHQTKRWNPKMAPYIYGSRNGIHIINLDKTLAAFRRAYGFVVEAVGRGGHVLFVGTKRQAQDVILEESTRAGQFHVTGRWLGGTLTNFRTMKISIDRLRSLERMEEEGVFETLTKKEALGLRREKDRLEKYLGGIKEMTSPPAVLFVIDPNNEHIAVREANKLEIPIVALTDTNCDPDPIDMVIPGNDDAIRSIKLMTSRIADACLAGQKQRRDYLQAGRREEDASRGVSVEFARTRRNGARFAYAATPEGEGSSGSGKSGGEYDEWNADYE